KDNRPNWQATATLNRGLVLDNDPPVIIDTTTGNPTTGDPFTFGATITDNIGVITAYIEYWNGTGTHTNVSMTHGSGNSYTKLITVPDTTDILYYIIRAKDNRPNWQATATLNRGLVIDNDPPVITNIDATPQSQLINGYVKLKATVTDNINVNTVKVNITGPVGFTPINTSMTLESGNNYYYNQSYSIVGTYNYNIWTKDTSNNGIKSSLYQFEIFAELQITTLKTGWNFVSLPFNLTIPKTNLFIISGGTRYTWSHAVTDNIILTSIYNWTRSKQNYNITNTLYPGEGYWMYAYSDCALWATNLTPMITNDFITQLKHNWSTVGVPIGSSVSKNNLIVSYGGSDYNWTEAVAAGLVVKDIFGWTRTVPQGYFIADVLDPGYCYWIYAYVDCTLKRT
ncbi:MAG: hypothetical protein IMZ43_07675, partial [Thermoplasmata archaeon]|nr:hypothetical protein [Thermoplasmata archaeon]